MALTGLQIQKLLPKTNCKECGSNTCLAFAMKLAAKKAELKECPYVSEEAKAILAAAAEPPIRSVALGAGAGAFRAGGETVLYRHEKTFVNRTGLGVLLPDTLEPARLEREVHRIAGYSVDRVGETLRVDAVGVECRSGNPERFAAACERAAAHWDRAIVARSDDAAALTLAAERLGGRKALLASATASTAAKVRAAAETAGAAVAAAGRDLDEVMSVVGALQEKGLRDIFLEPRARGLAARIRTNIAIRRAALKAGAKALGYPTVRFVESGDIVDGSIEAGLEVVKYGGLVLLPAFDPALFLPLLTLRQNIFTDPQKPIQVEPKVYAIGEPDERSPVFVTTNFSLTYFIVSSEIENSGTSAWLAVAECEGMSVLTAWAAGKFAGTKVAAFIKESGLPARLRDPRLVIPGYVAVISGEVEEALPGWKVLVGPQEASDIEGFVKNVLSRQA